MGGAMGVWADLKFNTRTPSAPPNAPPKTLPNKDYTSNTQNTL